MKQVTLFTIALLSALGSLAAPQQIKTIQSGDWSKKGNWNRNDLPGHGDTIVISASNTIEVSENVELQNVVVEVYGTIVLTGSSLFVDFNDNSVIKVYPGGRITGSKNSQQIKIGNKHAFQGDWPEIVGPMYASAATDRAFVAMPLSVLPVKFVGFSVARQNNDVLVQWSTAEEVAAGHYEVERSLNGTSWSTVAIIAAKGHSTTLTNYAYTDRNVLASTAYYRVRQVDLDGQFAYTQVRMIKSGNALDIKVAGFSNKVVLQFSAPVKGAVEVRLVSLNGQVISKQVLHQPLGQVVLNTTAAKGNYIVSVSNAQDIQLAKQVLL